jgi:hypothetical protein
MTSVSRAEARDPGFHHHAERHAKRDNGQPDHDNGQHRYRQHGADRAAGPDILVFNEQATQVFRNDGGQFVPAGQDLGSATAATTGKVALADFNDDGRPDIALARQIYESQIWLNQGHDQFTLAGVLPSAVAVSIADVNHDGNADLMLSAADVSRILFGDGAGGFTDSGQSLIGVGNFGDAALADLNGDGHADAVLANEQEAGKIYVNDGTGHFTDSGNLLPPAALSVAVGDLNGDHLPDLFLGLNGDDEVWLNQGNMRFIDSGQRLPGAIRSWDVALGDVNGDGAPDAVVASADPTPQVYLNDGTGNFFLGQQFDGGGADMVGVALADFNGDGHLDAVFTNFSGSNQLWFGGPGGQFSDSGQRFGSGRNLDVAAGDLAGMRGTDDR